MHKKNVSVQFLTLLFALTLWNCKETPREQNPKSKRPNILFAISDDQSFGHTSFGGSTYINTPAFDQIAKEGIYFKNFYAGSPGCAPSRSSIVTGRYHWQNEQSGQHASSWLKKHVSFIDLLEKNGYKTGRTGKGVGPFKYASDAQGSLFRRANAAGVEHSEIRYTEDNDERFASGINTTNYFENFKHFMEQTRKDEPFFFWYGGTEPHRKYEQDSWMRRGKKLADAQVPDFLPDNDIIRGDLLDYAVEIEWFDLHLQRMLEYLKETGELDNTIVIVTADNGMPFPRAKANGYDHGVHVPMAIKFPKEFPGGRMVEDALGFVDLAPTLLELTETSTDGMMPISGKSFSHILKSKESGIVDPTRKYTLAGRERHSSSRYLNKGYPQRIIKGGDYLYIWNMNPNLWPAGAPQKYHPKDSTELMPMYGLDEDGKFIPDTAFMDIDDCPTKTFLIENQHQPKIAPYFELAVGKRPEYELFNIKEDPDCINNLAGSESHQMIEDEMREAMVTVLKETNDPRVVGPDKEIFDTYIRYSPMRKFPNPSIQP
ncbi:sulfatase family protein [Euzebyella saccharophila]|uniref:Sulfatase n=1 Tax=Euzebyella saccharophila TaxID=679664 RepID=A0ABV8JKN9_9FLAO|nr:sulfatase [Euzebyella saccharophila]